MSFLTFAFISLEKISNPNPIAHPKSIHGDHSFDTTNCRKGALFGFWVILFKADFSPVPPDNPLIPGSLESSLEMTSPHMKYDMLVKGKHPRKNSKTVRQQHFRTVYRVSLRPNKFKCIDFNSPLFSVIDTLIIKKRFIKNKQTGPEIILLNIG